MACIPQIPGAQAPGVLDAGCVFTSCCMEGKWLEFPQADVPWEVQNCNAAFRACAKARQWQEAVATLGLLSGSKANFRKSKIRYCDCISIILLSIDYEFMYNYTTIVLYGVVLCLKLLNLI